MEGSYQCFADAPDKVRKLDISCIRRDHMPADEWPKGHNPIVPDLVVEVVSPNDLFSEVEVKVEESLRADVSLVWVVSPATRIFWGQRGPGAGQSLLGNLAQSLELQG